MRRLDGDTWHLPTPLVFTNLLHSLRSSASHDPGDRYSQTSISRKSMSEYGVFCAEIKYRAKLRKAY
jgi:hypothetical protein